MRLSHHIVPLSEPAEIAFELVWILIAGLYLAVSLLMPLRHTLLKARWIASKKFRKTHEVDLSAAFQGNEKGEFGELALELNTIYEKIQRKNEKIAREREELKALMSSMSDLMVVVNRDMRILFSNSRFQTYFLAGKEFKKGSVPLSDYLSSQPLADSIDQAIGMGNRCHLEMTTEVEPLSEKRTYAVTVSPLYERKDGGPIYGAICIFHDLTESRRLEQMRVDFVTNASHELRTPLTSVKGYFETLSQDLAAQNFEDVQKYIQIINSNLLRLEHLTEDLLQISRLESGSEKIRKDWLKTQDICESIREQLSSQIAKSSTQIVFRCETETVFGDRLKIEQVLINLVVNSLKYARATEVEVVFERKVESNFTALIVSDNGSGIAKEHLQRLFERFYRIDQGRSRTEGGTGLGLAIVKHIMQSHGGEILVSSELSKGTRFECRFPDK